MKFTLSIFGVIAIGAVAQDVSIPSSGNDVDVQGCTKLNKDCTRSKCCAGLICAHFADFWSDPPTKCILYPSGAEFPLEGRDIPYEISYDGPPSDLGDNN